MYTIHLTQATPNLPRRDSSRAPRNASQLLWTGNLLPLNGPSVDVPLCPIPSPIAPRLQLLRQGDAVLPFDHSPVLSSPVKTPLGSAPLGIGADASSGGQND